MLHAALQKLGRDSKNSPEATPTQDTRRPAHPAPNPRASLRAKPPPPHPASPQLPQASTPFSVKLSSLRVALRRSHSHAHPHPHTRPSALP
eukprot:scaffold14762_cov137-Isochrysis_galbana.AAC.3